MSLELRIEELTKAVIALTERLGAIETTQVEVTPQLQPQPQPQPQPQAETQADQSEGITAESLRDMCLSIVRNDRSKRAAIKDLMRDEFNATVVDDIDAKDFAKFKQMLEAL